MLLAILFLMPISQPLFASDTASSDDSTLSHRTPRLEKSRGTRGPAGESGLSLVGAIEVEGGHGDGNDGDSIHVATVELGLDGKLTSIAGGHVLLLYEEDDPETIEVDEAIITLASAASPWSLVAGRTYVPFGNYDSALLSDPLTQALGETRETALQLVWSDHRLSALLWLASGDVHSSDKERLDLYGAHVELAASLMHVDVSAGISWIANLADTDSLQAAIDNPIGHRREVPGIALHGKFNTGAFSFIAELVQAARHFDGATPELDGSRPGASNLELDYLTAINGRTATLAIARQQTSEGNTLELPGNRWLAAVSVSLDTHTTIGVEYARDSQAHGKHAAHSLVKLSMTF